MKVPAPSWVVLLRPPALGWVLLLAGFLIGMGSLAAVWVVARWPVPALRATVDSLSQECLPKYYFQEPR